CWWARVFLMCPEVTTSRIATRLFPTWNRHGIGWRGAALPESDHACQGLSGSCTPRRNGSRLSVSVPAAECVDTRGSGRTTTAAVRTPRLRPGPQLRSHDRLTGSATGACLSLRLLGNGSSRPQEETPSGLALGEAGRV